MPPTVPKPHRKRSSLSSHHTGMMLLCGGGFPAFRRFIWHLTNSPAPDQNAMEALAGFGDQAKPAVPALLGLLSHPKSDVRQQATNALQRIAPSAAALPRVE